MRGGVRCPPGSLGWVFILVGKLNTDPPLRPRPPARPSRYGAELSCAGFRCAAGLRCGDFASVFPLADHPPVCCPLVPILDCAPGTTQQMDQVRLWQHAFGSTACSTRVQYE